MLPYMKGRHRETADPPSVTSRRLRRAWYFVRSFFRSTRTLDDFPVIAWRQEPPTEEQLARARMSGGTFPTHIARIDGMFLTGTGATPAEARAELAERFEVYRAGHDTLPRPGTQTKIEFASTARLDALRDLRDDVVDRVLRFDTPIFVSDGSSLSDFPEGYDVYNDRIILLYGIDVDVLEDDRLATIVEAIAAR